MGGYEVSSLLELGPGICGREREISFSGFCHVRPTVFARYAVICVVSVAEGSGRPGATITCCIPAVRRFLSTIPSGSRNQQMANCVRSTIACSFTSRIYPLLSVRKRRDQRAS